MNKLIFDKVNEIYNILKLKTGRNFFQFPVMCVNGNEYDILYNSGELFVGLSELSDWQLHFSFNIPEYFTESYYINFNNVSSFKFLTEDERVFDITLLVEDIFDNTEEIEFKKLLTIPTELEHNIEFFKEHSNIFGNLIRFTICNDFVRFTEIYQVLEVLMSEIINE